LIDVRDDEKDEIKKKAYSTSYHRKQNKLTMKFSTAFTAICALPSIVAFAPAAFTRRHTALSLGNEGDVIFGGNSWKPDSDKMGVSSAMLLKYSS